VHTPAYTYYYLYSQVTKTLNCICTGTLEEIKWMSLDYFNEVQDDLKSQKLRWLKQSKSLRTTTLSAAGYKQCCTLQVNGASHRPKCWWWWWWWWRCVTAMV